MRTPVAAALAAWAIAACGPAEPEKPAEPEVPEKCKSVHVDKLASHDWIGVRGKSGADPKIRMRLTEKGGDYEAVYISDVSFKKTVLKGEKREKDVQLTEVGDKDVRARIYVVPKIEKCALEVLVGTVEKKDKEKIPPKGIEMVAFPEQPGVEFTYRPADRDLFLGKAAKNRAIAEKQVKEMGGADPAHEYGDIPVGLFSKADEDGPADCTYDMDLYFDDRNVPDLAKLPAGEVQGEWRHWFHLWKAPYSGNHHFEMYRYRTCDGKRELIDVAAIEAVLQ